MIENIRSNFLEKKAQDLQPSTIVVELCSLGLCLSMNGLAMSTVDGAA